MHWPQYFMLILILTFFVTDLARAFWGFDPKPPSKELLAFRALFRPIMLLATLYQGGFFPL